VTVLVMRPASRPTTFTGIPGAELANQNVSTDCPSVTV
jgi:hypothetical protein